MTAIQNDIQNIRIALLGNPNTGKTSLFNKLCGLRQKTGNYPGVTVDKKRGYFQHDGKELEVIDLPGINSLYPKSKDEELVIRYLLEEKEERPDAIVIVMSALNLKRNLYLLEQLKDLELPTIGVITMMDEASKRGVFIDGEKLQKELGIQLHLVSSKTSEGLEDLKNALVKPVENAVSSADFIEEDKVDKIKKFSEITNSNKLYVNFLKLTLALDDPNEDFDSKRQKFVDDNELNERLLQKNEAILRYKRINSYLPECITENKDQAKDVTSRLDKVLVHPIFGYVIFLVTMFLIFQSIFWLAAYPMDWIDASFTSLSSWLADVMSPGYFTDLLTDGIIPGIGGVVIFVPQIAILFFLFSLLEESGYMSRAVYLSDRFMQKFGMSGRSVIPLISGMACAIPAIMSARTIENNRDRLITILVTPLLTCSARLPVYIILIGLVVPDRGYGFFNLQGIALMGMYLLGIFMALIAGFVFKFILKSDYKSYLLMEMPDYLVPAARNVLLSMWTNVKSFVWNAGKIILATSIILFVLATNGGSRFDKAEEIVKSENPTFSDDEVKGEIGAFKLENSYLGYMGRTIEPVIKPLGYDWKIGIAVLSSLAAREVFVGTMSTIYSIQSEEEMTIQNRLRSEKKDDGSPVFSVATCISLLLFYAFSLQCLSTVAVTYKETGSLKWTAVQFLYMSILAYIVALIAYQVLA